MNRPAAHRVIIVEDEPALARALATAVENLDAQPVICPSGYRARKELSEQSFSVMILDIGLPDMNGLALLPLRNGANVLVIAARGNIDNAVIAKKHGAAAYLVKPVDPDQLRSTLSELLATAQPRPAPKPQAPIALPAAARKLPPPAKAAPKPATKTPAQAVPPAPMKTEGHRQKPTSPRTTSRMEELLTGWVRDRVAEGATYDEIHDEIEAHLLRVLMDQFDHKSTHMARALKMNRVTLLKRRKQFKLDDR